MQTAHELLIHGLNDMLSAERKLVDALEKLADQSSRPDLKKAFESHREQTEGQAERLEQCFEQLDEEPEEVECRGMQGLIEEQEQFAEEEEPAEDILDIFNAAAASKVESYEIAAYENLIRLADLMDHKKVSRLLNQNLKEEQQTLKKLQGLSKKMKPEQLEEEDEGEESMEVEGEEETGSRRGNKSAGRSRSRRTRAA